MKHDQPRQPMPIEPMDRSGIVILLEVIRDVSHALLPYALVLLAALLPICIAVYVMEKML